MMKLFLAAALLGLSTSAAAHEVWIERDGTGPARIYLGEPEAPLPAGGDPEFARLVAPKLLSPARGPMARRAGFIAVPVAPGDVRAWDDNVFQPWGDAGKRESVVYYARAGRSEARAAMPFEIVPETAGSDRFHVVRDGKPLPQTDVTLISPGHVKSSLKTDATGTVTVPAGVKGRYLLTANLKDEGQHTTPAGPVAVLYRIATTTFVR